jgi:hypothetical protein
VVPITSPVKAQLLEVTTTSIRPWGVRTTTSVEAAAWPDPSVRSIDTCDGKVGVGDHGASRAETSDAKLTAKQSPNGGDSESGQLLASLPQLSPIPYHDILRGGRVFDLASSSSHLEVAESSSSSLAGARSDGRLRLRPLLATPTDRDGADSGADNGACSGANDTGNNTSVFCEFTVGTVAVRTAKSTLMKTRKVQAKIGNGRSVVPIFAAPLPNGDEERSYQFNQVFNDIEDASITSRSKQPEDGNPQPPRQPRSSRKGRARRRVAPFVTTDDTISGRADELATPVGQSGEGGGELSAGSTLAVGVFAPLPPTLPTLSLPSPDGEFAVGRLDQMVVAEVERFRCEDQGLAEAVSAEAKAAGRVALELSDVESSHWSLKAALRRKSGDQRGRRLALDDNAMDGSAPAHEPLMMPPLTPATQRSAANMPVNSLSVVGASTDRAEASRLRGEARRLLSLERDMGHWRGELAKAEARVSAVSHRRDAARSTHAFLVQGLLVARAQAEREAYEGKARAHIHAQAAVRDIEAVEASGAVQTQESALKARPKALDTKAAATAGIFVTSGFAAGGRPADAPYHLLRQHPATISFRLSSAVRASVAETLVHSDPKAHGCTAEVAASTSIVSAALDLSSRRLASPLSSRSLASLATSLSPETLAAAAELLCTNAGLKGDRGGSNGGEGDRN